MGKVAGEVQRIPAQGSMAAHGPKVHASVSGRGCELEGTLAALPMRGQNGTGYRGQKEIQDTQDNQVRRQIMSATTTCGNYILLYGIKGPKGYHEDVR